MTSQVPWEAGGTSVEEIAGGYNWEAALSERGRASAWSPWWMSTLPPPPVEPIMLTGGIPDPASLPFDDLIAANETVLRREGAFALQYGGPQGYEGLRQWLADDINAREGLSLTAANFVLTCGSAGAFHDVLTTFVDPNDAVILEQPCYPGSTRVARSLLPRIAGVPVDEDGIVVDDLERVVATIAAEGRRPKVLYTISNFQNPNAGTMTLERRKAVVEICRQHGILIAQDDAYGGISFDVDPHPTLFTVAGGTGAVLMGTFSKTLATGLRVGWVMGEQTVVDAVTRMRFDMGVSPWTSRVLHEFAANGKYGAHVPKMVTIYQRKRDAMLAALDERCASFGAWGIPKGGFFVWMKLAEGIDTRKLRYAANEEAVGYVGGEAFFADGSGAEYIRLCYSNVAEKDIPEAVNRLGRALERASS
ncbi:MAG TPA: PLP-dependent aminotransferase family protein [Dehalococcoidia bacterium]|nr:PLP-dependent aminotransferase family protein [Dehalococcoidia bacterium]